MLLQPLTFLKGRYSFMKKVLSVLLAVALCFSVFSVAVFAEGEDIQLKLNAPANAKMGDTITVTVSLESNKGYAGLMYELGFDSTQLSLKDAKFEGNFAGDGSAAGMLGMFSDDKTRAASLVLPADGNAAGVTTETGKLATYTFKVLANGTKDAATNVNITLTVKNVFDDGKDMNDLSANAPTATVAVQYTDRILGDVSGDGEVTSLDVMIIKRYLAEWPDYVSQDVTAGDVSGDGEVTSLDVLIIKRHLAEWPGYEDLSNIK